MKKYGVIIYKYTDNFGDDVQTYAASRLLPKVDYFIDREELDSFCSENHEKVYTIFNGWFLYNNINFPPSKDIIPLPISMHFTTSMVKYPSSLDLYIHRLKKYLSYYSDYGVGCRDSGTINLLEDVKDTYVSYCLTLTLEKFNIERSSDDYICLVDVSDKVKKYVSENTNCNIKEFTHDYRNHTFENIPYDERMKNIEERLKIYQNAKCVITSRYHAALPSLALGTPVILIPSDYEPSRYADLDGLINMCNEETFLQGKIFDINNPPKNPTKHVKIALELKKRVKNFVDNGKYTNVYDEDLSEYDFKKYLRELEEEKRKNEDLRRILWAKTYNP